LPQLAQYSASIVFAVPQYGQYLICAAGGGGPCAGGVQYVSLVGTVIEWNAFAPSIHATRLTAEPTVEKVKMLLIVRISA